MSADCWGQHWDDPVVEVEDLDGQKMPFHPEVLRIATERDLPQNMGFQVSLAQEGKEPNQADPWSNWCLCGHLTVDHHFKAQLNKDPALYCWAKGCECNFIMPGLMPKV